MGRSPQHSTLDTLFPKRHWASGPSWLSGDEGRVHPQNPPWAVSPTHSLPPADSCLEFSPSWFSFREQKPSQMALEWDWDCGVQAAAHSPEDTSRCRPFLEPRPSTPWSISLYFFLENTGVQEPAPRRGPAGWAVEHTHFHVQELSGPKVVCLQLDFPNLTPQASLVCLGQDRAPVASLCLIPAYPGLMGQGDVTSLDLALGAIVGGHRGSSG